MGERRLAGRQLDAWLRQLLFDIQHCSLPASNRSFRFIGPRQRAAWRRARPRHRPGREDWRSTSPSPAASRAQADPQFFTQTPDHQAVPDPCPPPTGSSPRSRFPFPLDLRVHQQHKDEASSASGLRSSSGDPAGVTKIEPAAFNAGPSRPAPRSPHDGSRPRAEARSLSPSRASSASASVSPPPRRPPKRPLKPLRQLSALARRFVDVEAGVAGYASADEEDVDGSSDRSSAVIEEIEDPTESESEGG